MKDFFDAAIGIGLLIGCLYIGYRWGEADGKCSKEVIN